jgi:hypothetical protein
VRWEGQLEDGKDVDAETPKSIEDGKDGKDKAKDGLQINTTSIISPTDNRVHWICHALQAL